MRTINLLARLEEYFSKGSLFLLKEIGEKAEELNFKAYLVGGCVRDIILDSKHDVDLDIVIEGSAITFAQEFTKITKDEIVLHEKYGTAKLKLASGHIDLATARTEVYEYPAANPIVTFSTIKEDLSRRDFTINAMALSLAPNNFGEIIDFFNGYEDIKNKRLKILHDQSFIDDPNRIFRAVRFESKLDFTLAKEDVELAFKAMNSGIFDYFINDRIKNELKLIFSNRYNVTKNIARLHDLGALRCIDPKLSYLDLKKHISNLFHHIEEYKNFSHHLKEWFLYLILLLNEIKEENKFDEMITKIRLTKEEKNISTALKKLLKLTIVFEKLDNYDLYELLKKYPDEALLIFCSKLDNELATENIFKYLKELKKIKLNLSGEYFKHLGISDGKLIGEIQKELLRAKLNSYN